MTAAQQRWSVRLSTRHWIAWAQRAPRYSRERFHAELIIRELRIRHTGLVALENAANAVIRAHPFETEGMMRLEREASECIRGTVT